MPNIWADTVEQHQAEVRAEILAVTGRLAMSEGERSLTMSGIAKTVGIGRATLYKYFSDVDAILAAWHNAMIDHHLGALREAVSTPSDPLRRLTEAARVHAKMVQAHHGASAVILRPETSNSHVETVRSGTKQITEFFADLATAVNEIDPTRIAAPPDEYAAYLVHALGAAATTTTQTALDRLLRLTLPTK